MKLRTLIATCVLFAFSAGIAVAAGTFRQVSPNEFDPGKTFLVQAAWLSGIGCPTNAKNFNGTTSTPYTDAACLTGDPGDTHNEGLLLAKTGPMANVAAAQADLKDVRGIKLTELGYDIRKPRTAGDPSGSHCGAGAPRFNIDFTDGTSFFLGCNSPAANTTTVGNGWLRLRWGGSAPLMAFTPGGVLTNVTGKEVKAIQIVFDEGQDCCPEPADHFGLAVLDNIDVNTVLVGSGTGRGERNGDNNDKHKDKKGRHGDGENEQNDDD